MTEPMHFLPPRLPSPLTMTPIVPHYFQKPPSPRSFPKRREMKEFMKSNEVAWSFEEKDSLAKVSSPLVDLKPSLTETQPESEQSKLA